MSIATGNNHNLPFYTLTDEEKRIGRNGAIYFGVTFIATGVLTFAIMFLLTKLFNNSPIFGMLMIPVIAFAILIAMTANVHKLGSDSRNLVLAPHIQAANTWLNTRYGINLNPEQTQTLVYGGSYTVDAPKFTETGDTKRYGTHDLPGYPSGVQFTQYPTNGYRMVDLSN